MLSRLFLVLSLTLLSLLHPSSVLSQSNSYYTLTTQPTSPAYTTPPPLTSTTNLYPAFSRYTYQPIKLPFAFPFFNQLFTTLAVTWTGTLQFYPDNSTLQASGAYDVTPNIAPMPRALTADATAATPPGLHCTTVHRLHVHTGYSSQPGHSQPHCRPLLRRRRHAARPLHQRVVTQQSSSQVQLRLCAVPQWHH